MIKTKIKLILLSSFFVISAGIMDAQPAGKISGNVKDAANLSPLGNVNIIVVGTSRGAVTDNDGNYKIEGITEGSYTIQASMTGYKTERVKINLAENSSSKLTLIYSLRRTRLIQLIL